MPRIVWTDALAVLLFLPPNTLRRIKIKLAYVRAPMSSWMPCCLDTIHGLDRSCLERGVEHHLASLERVNIHFSAFVTTPLHRDSPSIEESKIAIVKRYEQSEYGKLYRIAF